MSWEDIVVVGRRKPMVRGYQPHTSYLNGTAKDELHRRKQSAACLRYLARCVLGSHCNIVYYEMSILILILSFFI